MNDDTFYHFKINESLGQYNVREFHIFPQNKFNTINLLLNYYRSHPVKKDIILELGRTCQIQQSIRPRDIWEVKSEDLKDGVVIGKGNFGTVKKATWKEKLIVAVKDWFLY